MSEFRVRVAILCAGLDGSIGGFETHMRQLHERAFADLDSVECMLFKSCGLKSANETPLGSPSRDSKVVQLLRRFGRDRFFWESLLFVVFFMLHVVLRRRRFDRIVVIEPTVRRIIFPIARFLPGNPQVIWTHGLKNDPGGYVFDADVIHEVNIENYERAKGMPERSANLALLPHFCADLSDFPSRSAARQRYGIRTGRVLLCVGRIESKVKRVDHIVREAALLPDDWTLILCGSLDEPRILADAIELLGDRAVHLEVKQDEVPFVYAASDILAHASLDEGFGIVILEAMRSSLGVIAHERRLFEWILEDGGVNVDMSRPGALAKQIEQLELDSAIESLGQSARDRYESAFSWETLGAHYESLLLGSSLSEHWVTPTHVRPKARALLRSRRKIAAKTQKIPQRRSSSE